MTGVLTGLDRLSIDDRVQRLVRGRRIGLVAHPASVDRGYRHASQVLREAGAHIVAYFGPEHGYGGEAQDMIGVANATSPEGAPIHSLYGKTEEALSPRPEWLDGIDAIVVDLVDVGARYYTFVWTCALMLEAAARRGIETIVFDRPNPLGGEVIEGRVQRPGYRSFVGLYDVPVRHGLTIAEIAGMVRREKQLDEASLVTVAMRGWSRRMLITDTDLPWVLPSPNMPTPETTIVYPGGCLLEGTLLSEGRGTTRPFEIFGAPYVDGRALAELEIEGAVLRPLTFTPTFHKHAGQHVGGVQVHVTAPRRFRSYEAYLRIIARVAELAPKEFAFRTEAYEFVTDRPAIDLLTGGPEYREAVMAGAGDRLERVLSDERRGASAFRDRRRELLLYLT